MVSKTGIPINVTAMPYDRFHVNIERPIGP